MSWRWDKLDNNTAKSLVVSRAAPFQQTDFSIKRLACLSVSQAGRLLAKKDEYLLRHEQSQELFRIIFLFIHSH